MNRYIIRMAALYDSPEAANADADRINELLSALAIDISVHEVVGR